MAFAFPKPGQAWLAPLAAAGLFWTWRRLSWKRAFLAGWFAGTIFFAINFSWFSYTVGAYVGAFAFGVVLVPALVEALAFAVSAVCARFAFERAPAALAPIAAAAAFAVFEWLRSIGPLAVPFAQIGYSQTTTALAIFAPYVGAFGVTFVTMLIGAYIAQALATSNARTLAVAVVCMAAAWSVCYAAWPARRALAVPALRVAAVQGNIAQSIKWHPEAFWPSVNTYLAQTRRLVPLRPQLVVLPETVIPTDLNGDDPGGARRFIRSQFARLAKSLNATLVVGSLDAHGGRDYNALYTFDPSGRLVNIYDKRQLVPFAESFPGARWLGWLPGTSLIGRFAAGGDDAVLRADGMQFAPLICWESAFPDLVHAQIARGAQFLVVATDDAWFGESSGTFQHAQIAQMRAIETGEWVLQSASTGISGIVAPDGTWREHTALDRPALLLGSVGAPALTFFARAGPTPVALAMIVLYVALVARKTHDD